MTWRLATCLVLAAVAPTAACKSDPPAGSPDARRDGLAGERGPTPDARRDAARPDQRPDRPQTPPHWELVPGTTPGVVYHTVTALQNGDVLIVGGAQGSGGAEKAFDTATLYEASKNAFVTVGNLGVAREGHTASLLADGRVLVAGGYNTLATALTSTELYDPGKRSWSPGPPLAEGRYWHQATRLGDGRLLVSGGVGADYLNTMVTFDPQSGAWSALVVMMQERRALHTATALASGKVLLAGGLYDKQNGSFLYRSTLEIFDPAIGQSSLLKSKLSRPRGGHTATRVAGDMVLLVGGACGDCSDSWTADLYAPATDTLLSLPQPKKLPLAHAAELLLDGRVLIYGNEDQTGGIVLGFTPLPPTWESLPPMKVDRYLAKGARLPDGSVLVVGGLKNDGLATSYVDQAERFFPY